MTRYVDRFHPAAMLTGFFGQPEVLETFRLINGSSGIVEAIIRWYGPIRATGGGFFKNDGFIKDPDYSGPTPAEIVKPLRAVKQEEQRTITANPMRSIASGIPQVPLYSWPAILWCN